MNNNVLKQTIAELFSNHKGLLAMDESISTCNKRFAAVQIPETVEMRRKYRELIVTTKGLNEGIGGAILFDETLRQNTKEGIPMAEALKRNGIIPGIKVDKHAKPMAGFTGEKITEGLDGLRERLEEYKTFGMRFAKWRAVISIGENIPTLECIEANATALARYAALCQEADIVPIVEPEVLMEGMILKPNMIIQGMDSAERNSVDKVAEYTVNCLLASVPANVPAVAFLSGGQSPELATAQLNAINKNYKNRLPWTVSFSFARAIQQPALEAWKGKDENVEKAQKLLYKRAKLDAIARNGQYNLTMEE
jgi:fructose-bisphosphate aldolase class I